MNSPLQAAFASLLTDANIAHKLVGRAVELSIDANLDKSDLINALLAHAISVARETGNHDLWQATFLFAADQIPENDHGG